MANSWYANRRRPVPGTKRGGLLFQAVDVADGRQIAEVSEFAFQTFDKPKFQAPILTAFAKFP